MSLKDAIDAYFREVDDEQFLKYVRAAGFKPIPRRSWADRLAFALMELAARKCRPVWQRPRFEQRLQWCEPLCGPRWRTRHDGWRPARYA